MVKRLLCVLLALCLALSVFSVAAAALEDGPELIEVFSEEDFYNAFVSAEGVITIPSDKEVRFSGNGRGYIIKDKIVVSENAVLTVGDNNYLEADIENNGEITVCRDAMLYLSCEDGFVNNGTVTVMKDGGIAFLETLSMINNGTFRLYGLCAVGITTDSNSVELTGNGSFECEGGIVVLYPIDEQVDLGSAAAATEATFSGADVYAYTTDFGGMLALNDDDRIKGIYIEGEVDRAMIPVGEDITINKKLCVKSCDLVLQQGVTMTINNHKDNLMFMRDGRIVCESEGAAGPDCPAGGTLVLDKVALISGDPAVGAINPTRDIIWLQSGNNSDGPEVLIGDNCGADVHGDISALDDLIVRMDFGQPYIRMTDNFTCATIILGGEIDAEGNDLTAGEIFYSDNCRINAPGEITGEAKYALDVDTRFAGYFRLEGVSAGERVYLEDMHVPYKALESEGSFKGWRAESGWADGEALEAVTVTTDDDPSSDTFGKHYITMPAFPVRLTTLWDTYRAELSKYDATVAFDGVVGHTYDLVYFDSENTSAEEFAELGFSREAVDQIVANADEQIMDGDLLRILSFRIADGENEIDDNSIELRIALNDEMAAYDKLSVIILHIEGTDVHLDFRYIPCRVEDGVLIAELDGNDDAFAIVGSQMQIIDRVELQIARPSAGTSTDTPFNENEDNWDWRGQINRPEAQYRSGRGGYVEEAFWCINDNISVPYIGTFENGRTYTLKATVLAEPDFRFADDVEIVIDGAKYITHNTHICDEDGMCDILEVVAQLKPVPNNVICGDTDSDGEVSIVDVTVIQRDLAGIETYIFVEEAADVDGDGEISILDATAIQRYLCYTDINYPIGNTMT